MLAVFACPPTLSKLESKILSMCRLNSISYVENGPDYYAGQNLASIGNVTRCNLLVSKAFLNNAGHSQVDSWIGWHVKGANLMFLGWTMYRCLSSKSVLDTWVSCSWGTLNFSFSQILYLCLSFPSLVQFSSVQSLSRVQLFVSSWTAAPPGLPVNHQLPESTQTHVHCVGDAIQPSHPLLSPSPPDLNPSQFQGLFKWLSSPHQVAKVLEFQLQHQSFQWTPRTDLL